jgi:hypothetical protein
VSGTPFVRVRCADYGDEWVVEWDVFSGDEREPHTSGPYSFGSEQDAKQFVAQSLRDLQPAA